MNSDFLIVLDTLLLLLHKITEFTSDANTISLQHFNTMLSQDATYTI